MLRPRAPSSQAAPGAQPVWDRAHPPPQARVAPETPLLSGSALGPAAVPARAPPRALPPSLACGASAGPPRRPEVLPVCPTCSRSVPRSRCCRRKFWTGSRGGWRGRRPANPAHGPSPPVFVKKPHLFTTATPPPQGGPHPLVLSPVISLACHLPWRAPGHRPKGAWLPAWPRPWPLSHRVTTGPFPPVVWRALRVLVPPLLLRCPSHSCPRPRLPPAPPPFFGTPPGSAPSPCSAASPRPGGRPCPHCPPRPRTPVPQSSGSPPPPSHSGSLHLGRRGCGGKPCSGTEVPSP